MLLREVAGTQAAPVDAFNLVAAADKPQGDDWMTGIAWRSEICPAWDGVPTCGPLAADLPVGGDGINRAMPVTFRTVYSCTTLSERTGATQRAERQALAITSHVVARELWTGELSRADPWLADPAGSDELRTNANLMAGANVVVATGTVQERLAALEEEARSALGGQRVLLHTPIRVMTTLSDLHRVGNEMRTNANSTVVGDSGYTGQGPYSGGTEEVQEVAITGAPTGGTFTLTFDGETTGPIPYNATPGQVQVSLTALPNLTTGQVAVTGTPGDWTVTFASSMGNVAQLTADDAGLTGGVDPAVAVTTTTPGVADTPSAGLWAYATGPVAVRLGAVETFPEVSTHQRSINRVAAIAVRSFIVSYDDCAAYAVQLQAP